MNQLYKEGAGDVSSYPYVSSYTFRFACDHGWLSPGDFAYSKANVQSVKDGIDPDAVKEGDTVYIVTDHLDNYFRQIHPKIKNRYVLVTGRADRGVDQSSINYMDDKIIRWFSSNVSVEHPKLEQIPLGIQNPHWRIKNHPQSDISLLDEVNSESIDVNKDVLMSFQQHTNPGQRRECYTHFQNEEFITIRNYGNNERTDRNFVKEYFREIKRHKFTLCPFGGGFDCHRNWEVLSLGAFPIIKRHISMDNFTDLPIWFVDNWSEVNPETIDKKYDEIKTKLDNNEYNLDKIFFDYWFNKINGYTR